MFDLVTEADFETAISATGFGLYNLLLLLVATVSGWAIIFDITTMSYILPAAYCDLDLTLGNRGLLNAITIIGMISSGLLWGYLADSLGRKHPLVFGYLLDSFFALLAAVSQNFPMILFAKFMSGFTINGPAALLTTVFSEFHAAKYRARVVMTLGLIYETANISIPFIAWLTLTKNLELDVFTGKFRMHAWNYFLLISAIPSMISSLLHAFLPESPKFLMTVGRNEEALQIFRNIYYYNTGKVPDTYRVKSLVDEIKLQTPTKRGRVVEDERTSRKALITEWKQIKLLLTRRHIMKLLVVCTLQSGFMSGCHALRMWLPQMFTAINDYQKLHPAERAGLCKMLGSITSNRNASMGECDVITVNKSVLINIILVGGCSVVGYISISFYINIVGKKPLLLGLGLISGVSGFAMYFAHSSWTTLALSSIVLTLSRINTNIVLAVVVDLFPTTLRTTTVSITIMAGMVGAMLGNLTFPFLLKLGCLPPFLTMGLVMTGCGMLSIVLPKTDLKALE